MNEMTGEIISEEEVKQKPTWMQRLYMELSPADAERLRLLPRRERRKWAAEQRRKLRGASAA